MKNRKGIHKIPFPQILSSVLHGPERKKIPVSDKYNPLKNEIFLPIPLKIAQRKDLKNLSKLVYGYLLKCFGKNDLACPKMAEIAKDLNVSRQIVSKCITELKTKDLIKICKTGKASRYEFIDVNTVLTSDVNTVLTSDVNTALTSDVNTALTSDVNTALTSPIIKRKNKRKNKKSGATPDSFNFWHPYIDEIMAAMPEQAKGKISRAFINEHLKKKGGDRPYFYWVFDHAADKPDPVKWITMGIRGYYAAYLKSDDYESEGTITEFKRLETV
jgi:predicted transcriptional regulator